MKIKNNQKKVKFYNGIGKVVLVYVRNRKSYDSITDDNSQNGVEQLEEKLIMQSFTSKIGYRF